MSNIMLHPCIIENGINTCYIDSLLVALFYQQSAIDDILNHDPKDACMIYLQELIKSRFVEKMRHRVSIGTDDINMIRNYAVQNGWCNDSCDIYEQQDVSEFYNFLLNGFSANYLEFEKIKMNNSDGTNNGLIEKLPFIPLHPSIEEGTTSVRELLIKWINNTLTETNNTEQQYCYCLKTIPSYLPLCINRFTNQGERIHTQVDIMKRIKLFEISDKMQSNIKWKIHSIICNASITPKSGHYYTVLLVNDMWILFDDTQVPSFKQVDINDRQFADRIMRECVMIFYILE